jgi:drug/metabolite transporter (DMT)-like permease
MNSTIIASLCGLLAAISWGFADFLAAKATKTLSGEKTALIVSFISALAFVFYYLIEPGSTSWGGLGIVYAAAAGIFMGVGLLFFYRGLEAGPVSVVSPIGGAYPLVTTLLVLGVLGGRLSALQITGILFVVVGIVASSGFNQPPAKNKRLTKGVIMALCTFVLWGISFTFLGQAVEAIGWQKTTLIEIWLEFLAILFVVPFFGHKLTRYDFSLMKDKFIAGTALLQLLGLVVFDYGLTHAVSTAVITAISASYPALTIFLAIRILKEKQTVIALLGGFVTVVGVIILSAP